MPSPLLDLVPLPAFVANATGDITDINRCWIELFGDDTAKCWPRDFDIESPRVGDDFHGHNHPSAPPRVQATLASGDPRWFDVHCQPLESDEQDHRTLGVLVDVTDQTRREAEMMAILRTAVDGIVLIDETGRIEMVNAAAEKLLGYQPGELTGAQVDVLMGPEHRRHHTGYIRRYIETGEARIIGIGRELEAVTKQGKRLPVHLSVSEVRLAGRRRFTGFLRDLSEQRATQEMLTEQRERLAHVGRLSTMGEMTASIAHEINQPLTAIAMYAQSGLKLLQREAPDLNKLSMALDKLNTQSLRAGAIIERIQRFTRADPAERELVNINALLTDLLKLTEGDARLNDIELNFDLDPTVARVRADPVQIQQVALNLIRNAIDAMNDIKRAHGNQVRVRTRALPQGGVMIAVDDQGPGVPDDQRDLIFSAFHTTKRDGMGMGLSICRTIITEHGGELGFCNHAAPEPGATFHFTLPGSDHDHESI
ncbi:MAG: two-component system sensor histidine kinase NtrB [Pseudomonadales bacterium]